MDEKCVKMQNPEHSEQKTSTCTGTGQAVPVHMVKKEAVGNLYRYRLNLYRYTLAVSNLYRYR